MVMDNPAVPLAFTKNQKGMQGGEALDGEAHNVALATWLAARDSAVEFANRLADLEVHKQYANRVLEPWAHITVVVTATDWDNFFALRCHEAAQPEIHALADLMYGAYSMAKPVELRNGEWHMPFITEQDDFDASSYIYNHNQSFVTNEELLVKRSVAKCARVSYLNHDGTKTYEDADLDLYDRLLGSAPLHASPAEHQAMAVGDPDVRSGNFRGWVQYRKTLRNENVREFRK